MRSGAITVVVFFSAVASVSVSASGKRPARDERELPFDVPRGWHAAAAPRTETAAAPPDDVTFDLQAPADSPLRVQVVLYAGRVGDADLDDKAAQRHQARVKNRVAWGMKAAAGPPRESLKLSARRAVRWHDSVGGALGDSEQIMTCVTAGGRLACVISTGSRDSSDAAESLAATLLDSLKR